MPVVVSNDDYAYDLQTYLDKYTDRREVYLAATAKYGFKD